LLTPGRVLFLTPLGREALTPLLILPSLGQAGPWAGRRSWGHYSAIGTTGCLPARGLSGGLRSWLGSPRPREPTATCRPLPPSVASGSKPWSCHQAVLFRCVGLGCGLDRPRRFAVQCFAQRLLDGRRQLAPKIELVPSRDVADTGGAHFTEGDFGGGRGSWSFAQTHYQQSFEPVQILVVSGGVWQIEYSRNSLKSRINET
jgi:hypothetical protein